MDLTIKNNSKTTLDLSITHSNSNLVNLDEIKHDKQLNRAII